MTKKIFIGIALMLASILAIALAVIMFINLPDKQNATDFTVKETLQATGAVFLVVFGFTGIISGVACILSEWD